MLASLDGKPMGVWMFVKQSQIWLEIHTALLPEAWGRIGFQAALQLSDWIWTNTEATVVTTRVPTYNRRALVFAKASGMKVCGIIPKSYRKNGETMDVTLLAATRPSLNPATLATRPD